MNAMMLEMLAMVTAIEPAAQPGAPRAVEDDTTKLRPVNVRLAHEAAPTAASRSRSTGRSQNRDQIQSSLKWPSLGPMAGPWH